MRLALLFSCLFCISTLLHSQDFSEHHSIGLVLSFEHSELEPGRDADPNYMTLGLEYEGRFNQIGIRSGFTLSRKFRRNAPWGDLTFPTSSFIENYSNSRYLELPLTLQYYPRGLGGQHFQAYFSGGVNASFGQNRLTDSSFKGLYDDTTFRQVSALGFLVYFGKHCSLDMQYFFKFPFHSPKFRKNRGNIYGLQTKLNYIF